MKVKRFNNLWAMGLILCGVLLIAIYLIKIIFPQLVIEISQIETITIIGHYIDNNKWAWYLVSFVISFFSGYLICCACCEKKSLNYKENLILAISIIFVYSLKELIPEYYTAVSYIHLIALPCILKGKFTNTTIIFSSLILLQIMI